jgi:MFS family permease
MTSLNSAISPTKDIRKIIVASSIGTLVEWYDFFVYGSLATVLAGQFFPRSNPAAALLATLAIFSVGFIARPFGALVFGRPNDHISHKYSFPLTQIILGGSTFCIGLIPGYAQIGYAAPLLVLLFRLLQGLALGGEYGGAAAYVAEHAPRNRRGFYTSWKQAAATLGVFVSLAVILLVRHGLDADQARSIEKFDNWGWRIPFLFSIILVAISVYVRLKMKESPLFQRPNPLTKSIEGKANLKMMLLILFGAAMGQGVVFYTGQFYAQSFLETVVKIDFDQSKTMLLVAILLATPFFVVFGGLSDRIGRKWIMLGGMALAILTYPFLFRQLLTIPATEGRTEITSQKEILSSVAFIDKTRDMVRTSSSLSHYDGGLLITEIRKDTVYASGKQATTKPHVNVSRTVNGADYWKMTGVLFLMVFYVTMVCGPGAAFLVEFIPTNVRHRSLPSQIGNGIFGGMTPFIAMLLTTIYTGHPLAGLWYPIGVSAVCLVVGVLCIPGKTRITDLEN